MHIQKAIKMAERLNNHSGVTSWVFKVIYDVITDTARVGIFDDDRLLGVVTLYDE